MGGIAGSNSARITGCVNEGTVEAKVNRKKTELQQVKVAKEGLLKEREEEKVKLEAQVK